MVVMNSTVLLLDVLQRYSVCDRANETLVDILERWQVLCCSIFPFGSIFKLCLENVCKWERMRRIAGQREQKWKEGHFHPFFILFHRRFQEATFFLFSLRFFFFHAWRRRWTLEVTFIFVVSSNFINLQPCDIFWVVILLFVCVCM